MAFFQESKNPAQRGLLDRLIRRFGTPAWTAAMALMYGVGLSAYGVALVPALAILERWGLPVWHTAAWWRLPAFAGVVMLSAFAWGFTLLVVVPLYNWVLPTRLHAFKGGYFTIASLPWFIHNSLFYLVRYTILPFVTLTPVGPLFLQAMGMKIGKRVRIGTEYFSDVNLITLGDDVAIGGSATIFCHVAGGGHLIIAPVVIGARAQIGLRATIMGDVHVGEDAVILAHSVLLPGTRVGPGERWGGVPARQISKDEWSEYARTVLRRV